MKSFKPFFLFSIVFGIWLITLVVDLWINQLFSTIILYLVNLILFAVAFLYSNRSFNQLKNISDFTKQLSKGSIPGRLRIEGPQEIIDISDSINLVAENLNAASEFASNIGEGNFEKQTVIFNDKGALAESLYKMRENLRKVTEEDKKRNWTTEGLAKFGEILRENKDLQQFSDSVISNLVKYLKANQGGLFILNDSDKDDIRLDLISSFAYDRKKFLNKTVRPGEGMVGQCYLEQETIYLTDLPDNYISITSGLGDSAPRCLLIVPLKVNEIVEGVIEIASFEKFDAHKISFVEKIGENIGSTLAGVKNNENTKKLLEATKNQAEELRAQEEEMRQNLEEMQSTQEEMRRLGLEMEGQLKSINVTMATIEFDLKGNIVSANDNFLKLMKYSLEEIKGKHHSIFVEKEERESEDYRQFWTNLASGKAADGEFKRVSKSGDQVYIKGIYNPILNAKGEPTKVLKLAYDITEQKKLFFQSQEQLSVVQAQEEELRQSMEEMQATQEEMRRLGSEMEGQLKSINVTMATIEFDLTGNIVSANENFLELMKYSIEEIKGKHHSIFVEKEERESEDYKRFWTSLASGKAADGEFKRVTKAGDAVFIKGIYNPILNAKGEPTKVLKLAYDITEQKMLFNQSQEQLSLVQAQEEELRQSMEEMEATQEEMRRLTSEMEGQLKAINTTMATIEFDLKGNIVTANDNFLQLMKYSLKEIQGKHHSIFVDKVERESEDYKRFWIGLGEGKASDGEFKRITNGGDEVYIKGIYNPILNAKGEPTKVLKLAYDITEQKRLFIQGQEQLSLVQAQEEELRQSMEEMEATQEEMRRLTSEMEGQLKAINSTMATIEFDLKGNIITANDNFLHLMKYSLNEIQGKHHSIFVEKVERESEDYKQFWNSLALGKSSDGEFKRITNGGDEVYIKGIYNPILNAKGEPTKVLKLAYDITEQKRLFVQGQEQLSQVQAQEEELRQSMEEMEATQEEMRRLGSEMEGQLKSINVTMATIEFDLKGNIVTANENFLQLMRYSLEDIRGKHHSIFVDKQERKSEAYKQFWLDLASGKSADGEFKRITKDGDEVYIKGIYNPILDAKGEPTKVLKLAYDITEQKRLLNQTQEHLSQVQAQEEELRQSMEEMETTQEEVKRLSSEMEGQIKAIDSTMATIEFDLQGNILTANENFLNLMGYRLDEIRGKHHKIFVSKEEVKSQEYLEFWQKLSRGVAENGEFKRFTKTGKEVYINGIYNPIFNSKGEPVKVLKLAYDITIQKLMFAETREQLDKVQAQEEELRQNTEELVATQEEMTRLSSEMESQLKAINSTVATIEFDLSGNILTANNNFLKLVGYELQEVIGKHHKIFVDKTETNSKAYVNFWKDLSEGKACEGEFKRIAKGGKEIFIKGMYNPVLNKEGVPVKIFKLAYNVTDKKLLEKELNSRM